MVSGTRLTGQAWLRPNDGRSSARACCDGALKDLIEPVTLGTTRQWLAKDGAVILAVESSKSNDRRIASNSSSTVRLKHPAAPVERLRVLSRSCVAEAMAWTKAVMTRLGLTRLVLDLFVTALSQTHGL